MRWPDTCTTPRVGRSKPPRRLSSVVLPEPESLEHLDRLSAPLEDLLDPLDLN